MRANRKSGVAVAVLALLIAGILPALASHNSDAGVDEAWTAEMNQPAYWELRFGGEGLTVDCTKYENHSGYVPGNYEAAVIKDGTRVRVYNPAPSPFTALGAVNPANGKHFKAPHSWVMKCDITGTPTTTTPTTQPPPTTTPTTEPPPTTTPTTEPPPTTTPTTEPPPTTTPTTEPPPSTVPPTDPPSTEPPTTPPVTTPPPPTPPATPPVLPFTGPAATVGLIASALAMLGGGVTLVRKGRQ